MAFTTGCRKHSLPGIWSTLSPFFFPDLGGRGWDAIYIQDISLSLRIQGESREPLPLWNYTFIIRLRQIPQQNYSKFSCFWETEPVGCRRISCDFFHRKPRNINGLYLPPSNNVPLKQDVQGGILHPTHRQDSLRNQDNVLVPIHPPLIINLSDEEDDEEDDEDDDDEEDSYVSSWMPKTVIDIEEERAIRDICYKSGEYYGIQNPYKHQSTKTVSSPWQDELLPLETTEQNLQKGDGNTIPTRFNNTRKEKESSERRLSIESIPKTDHKSFDSGETNNTELVKNHHFKEVKENKRISEERRNSANAVTGKGIHTPDPKGKPGYQQRGQSKEDETASSSPYGRDTGRYTHLNSPEPRRSAYVVYRTVTQKPKFNGPTAVPESYGQKGSKQKNQPDTNRRFWTQTENYGKYTSGSSNSPAWRKRNPQAKPFSKFKITTQSKEDMEVNKKGEKETSKGK
uniref:uncharacterized protein C12orf50 homolog n=1 Tax=Agelaius phoeniceus TaxID=39638 RepID=UPI0023ECCABD|nr:uncharacterized protein C12orf50 homolog [Agelaius phoeniceus]